MTPIIVFDTEYLAIDGSMRRFWSGMDDPDPLVVQIGAAKIDLDDGCAIVATKRFIIRPIGRSGEQLTVGTYLEALTGLTNLEVARSGISLSNALHQLDEFAEGGKLWSWGKDELVMIGISCFINGILPPISAARFGNCKDILFAAGMPREDIATITSGKLASFYGLAQTTRQEHDALDDALSLADTFRHLFKSGALTKTSFER